MGFRPQISQIEGLKNELDIINTKLNSIVPVNFIYQAPVIVFSDDLIANVTNTPVWYEGTTRKETTYPDDIVLSPKPSDDLKRFTVFYVELNSSENPIPIYAKEGVESLTPIEPFIESYEFVLAKALVTNVGAAIQPIATESIIYFGQGGDDNNNNGKSIVTRVATLDRALILLEDEYLINSYASSILVCLDCGYYAINNTISPYYNFTIYAPNARIETISQIMGGIDMTLSITCKEFSGGAWMVANGRFFLNCESFGNTIFFDNYGQFYTNAKKGYKIDTSYINTSLSEPTKLYTQNIELDTTFIPGQGYITIGTINGIVYPINHELISNKNASNGYAGLTNGLISINQIPPAALERLVIVANQTARYALTTSTVQNGDTVKQTDTNLLYFVKDDTNLSNANGYEIYTAGSASSVPWSGITSIPIPVQNLTGTNTGDQDLSGKVDKVTDKSLVFISDILKIHDANKIEYAGTTLVLESNPLQSYNELSSGLFQEFIVAVPTIITNIKIWFGDLSINTDMTAVLDLFNGVIRETSPAYNNTFYSTTGTGNLNSNIARVTKVITAPLNGAGEQYVNFILPTPVSLTAGTHHFAIYSNNNPATVNSINIHRNNNNTEGTTIGRTFSISGRRPGIEDVPYCYFPLQQTTNINFSIYAGASSAIARNGGVDVNGELVVTGNISALNFSLSNLGGVAANTPITGATKTKVTYDSKGLVTSGADATTADIAVSTDKNYVTDAQLVVIGNTSGTNSGNETAASIGAIINSATDYTTPLDADKIGIWNFANSLFKSVTWANIKTTLASTFQTILTFSTDIEADKASTTKVSAISYLYNFFGKLSTINIWTLSQTFTSGITVNSKLNLKIGEYVYTAASDTADTVGDTREINVAGITTKSICTVANAVKGGGNWATLFTIDTSALTSSNIKTNNIAQVSNDATLNLSNRSFSSSSANQTAININPTVNQSATAGFTALKVNTTETAIGSGIQRLADLQVGGVSKFFVDRTGAVGATSIFYLSSGAGDVVGDFKETLLNGAKITSVCTTASATKGGGTWVITEAKNIVKTLTNNITTSLFSLTLPTLNIFTGIVKIGVEVINATDTQVWTGTMELSSANKAGVYSSNFPTTSSLIQTNTAKTISVTTSILTGTNLETLQINVNSNLSTPTIKVTYSIEQLSKQTITII